MNGSRLVSKDVAEAPRARHAAHTCDHFVTKGDQIERLLHRFGFRPGPENAAGPIQFCLAQAHGLASGPFALDGASDDERVQTQDRECTARGFGERAGAREQRG